MIQLLIDIVSKNGNLMLNIPVRATAPSTATSAPFLDGLATWMPKHGEAIYGTRPFVVFGEGPPDVVSGPVQREAQRPYTIEDIRFTRKGDTVYAFAFVWPTNGKLLIKTLARGASALPKPIQRIELIGAGPVPFTQDATGLTLNLPDKAPNPYAYAFILRT